MATAQDFIDVARSQVGYKESPAGSNRTKYGAWYGMDGQPWCAMFASWCFDQVDALDLVGGKFAYTPSWAAWFRSQGQWLDREEKPQPGDLVFFSNSTRICHVGIVTKRNGTSSVSTIEGNTSAGSNANGGQVQARTRGYGMRGSSWWIAGFGRPAWTTAAQEPTGHPVSSAPASTGSEAVKQVQRWLNNNYNAGLDVDGEYGPLTKRAIVRAYQRWLNSTYGAGLAVDGIWGPRTRAATRVIKRGQTGNGVKLLQAALICNGYSTNGFDGIFGGGTDGAVRAYQSAHGLQVDGQAGRDTFSSLFG